MRPIRRFTSTRPLLTIRGRAVRRLGVAAVLVVAATWAAGSGGVRAAGWPELQALASCDDGVVVQLTGDVSERQTLVVGCDATIDLNGRTLNVISTDVRANLTIDDTAGGGRYEATLQNDGLAGIHVPAGTSVTIRAGHIDAWGGAGAAGIGGQPGEDAGSVTILGGTVVAQGGGRAAAIGAPTGGDGGIIDIDAGTVYATGGANAPGIGSGCGGGDATLRIGEHATAVVDTFDFSIICEAHALRLAGPLPVLQVDGVLSLRHGITGRGASWAIAVPAGPPAAIVVGPTGTIMGPQNNPTTNARFAGAGSIDNHGVIALDESLVQAEVTDHNYLLTFEPAGGPTQRIRVFAPDFASSYRTAPALTPGSDWWVVGEDRWWLPDEPLTHDLTLVETVRDPGNPTTTSRPDDSTTTTGSPGGTTPAVVLHLTATATTVSQGGRVVFTVTAEDEHGNPVDPAGAVLSSSVVTDVIDGLAVTFASPGTHVITAALGGLTANVTVDVVPPVITVAPPPPSVTPPTPPRLPATGNSSGPLVRAATLMLAFGALAALATRRHVRS